MKKVIVSVVVVLFALTISFQANAQNSVLYEGEGFNVQFTYDNDGKAMEIIMKSADADYWVKLQIVEFQPFDDGSRYVTKNPVGDEINMTFFTTDELIMSIVVSEEKISLNKVKSYPYDNRKFK